MANVVPTWFPVRHFLLSWFRVCIRIFFESLGLNWIGPTFFLSLILRLIESTFCLVDICFIGDASLSTRANEWHEFCPTISVLTFFHRMLCVFLFICHAVCAKMFSFVFGVAPHRFI